MFYGPGGAYAMFSGKDASRALAKLSFDPKEINGNLEGLCDSELETLLDWECKFMVKYAKVGQLVPCDPPRHGNGETGEAETTSVQQLH
ncbi:unnamed protein product [Cuscuta campestris]|uniref:Cytochrome b5 heme-binding domain-containing protein n=1 Tax=Cuscuta campestris TaxID=132261 RepID=A0A484MW44_9ASTE|nr:unnamed protein product [Cuscuta campestris]